MQSIARIETTLLQKTETKSVDSEPKREDPKTKLPNEVNYKSMNEHQSIEKDGNRMTDEEFKSKERAHKVKDNDKKSRNERYEVKHTKCRDGRSKHHEERKYDNKHNSRKRKRDCSKSSKDKDNSRKSKTVDSSSKKKKTEIKCSIGNDINLPRTNRERNTYSGGKAYNSDDSKLSIKKNILKPEHIKKESINQEKIHLVENHDSYPKQNQRKIAHNNDKKASTRSNGSSKKEVVPFSHRENVKKSTEFDTTDPNQCFVEGKRLKHLGNTVSSPMEQCLLYLEAVLYFLLTGDAMEKAESTEAAVFKMFEDTLSIIEYISRRYKQHLYTKMFSTLAVLK